MIASPDVLSCFCLSFFFFLLFFVHLGIILVKFRGIVYGYDGW